MATDSVLRKLFRLILALCILGYIAFEIADFFHAPVQRTNATVLKKLDQLVKRGNEVNKNACLVSFMTDLGTTSKTFDRRCQDSPWIEGQHISIDVRLGRFTGKVGFVSDPDLKSVK